MPRRRPAERVAIHTESGSRVRGFFCGSIREEAHQVEFIYDGQPTSWSTQRTLRRKTVTKAEKVGEGLERREEMVDGSAAWVRATLPGALFGRA